jgi:hypothetical protein
VEECAIEMAIWMSHPAVSLLIFRNRISHLRVDPVQIPGNKLSSPWDFEYLIYARARSLAKNAQ